MAEETEKSEPKAIKATPPRAQRKCSKEGCKRPYRAKGYCNVHYREWRHGGLDKQRYKICTKEGCRKPRAQGSLCAEHLKPAGSPAAA